MLGVTSSSSDGDVHNHIGNSRNFWIVEVDSTGSVVWDNCYGGGSEGAYTICKAMDGSIWVAGTSSFSGGQVYTHYGRNDAFLIHADSAGNFLSAKVLGGSENDQANLIYPLSNNDVLVGGYYQKNDGEFSSLSFYNIGSSFSDTFFVKFSPWTTSVEDVLTREKKFTIYPNPASKTIVIHVFDDKQYNIRISDSEGREVYRDKGRGDMEVNITWSPGVYQATYLNRTGQKFSQGFVVQ